MAKYIDKNGNVRKCKNHFGKFTDTETGKEIKMQKRSTTATVLRTLSKSSNAKYKKSFGKYLEE